MERLLDGADAGVLLELLHAPHNFRQRLHILTPYLLVMSTINSIGSYDSLFDDEEETLGGICFDLGVPQVASSDRKRNETSWCQSSSSSCCSICRLAAVSEADEDDSNRFGPSSDASVHSPRPSGADAAFTSSRDLGTVRPSAHQLHACCKGCNIVSSNYAQCMNQFQVPIKSISIPRSCFDLREAKAESQAVPRTERYGEASLIKDLPDDSLFHVIKFLDVSSLVRLRECNRKLRDAASKNHAGWTNHCTSLWSRKANVCSTAREMLAQACKKDIDASSQPRYAAMEAFKIAVTDATTRSEITPEEICFDSYPEIQGTTWSFRFKECAGRDWTSWDPWWNRQDARKLVFLRDGTVMQLYPKGVLSSAKNHNGTSLYDVFSERTIIRDGAVVPAPRIEMKWRFVSRPLDLPERPQGAYVRITVGGRDVPTYVVRRSPNGNWGFILESCWGLYTSFDMTPQALPSSLIGRSRRRLRRTRNGSRWVNVEDSDSDDEEERQRERMRNVRRRIDMFLEDSAAQHQWREAMLYNIGAVTLPEGEDNTAEDEFDHAWQNAMMIP